MTNGTDSPIPGPENPIDGDGLGSILEGARLGRPILQHDAEALAEMLGRGPAAVLIKQLQRDGKDARKVYRLTQPRKSLWRRFIGPPPHEASMPLPDSLASIIMRVQSGEPLGPADVHRLGKKLGRKATRALIHTLEKGGRKVPGWGWI